MPVGFPTANLINNSPVFVHLPQMVKELEPKAGCKKRLLLTPNQSMSWAGNVLICMPMFVVSVAIGAFFMVLGAWVIFPFALLEVCLLLGIFYYVNLKLRHQQVVTVADNRVIVEKGGEQLEQKWDFSLGHLTVMIQRQQSAAAVRAESVMISGNRGIVTIGEFLGEEDAERLVCTLKQCGLCTCEHGPFVRVDF